MIIRAFISLVAAMGYFLGIDYLFIGGGVLCVVFMAVQYVYYKKEIHKLEEKIKQAGDFDIDLNQRRAIEKIGNIFTLMIIGGAIYALSFLWSNIWQAVLWVAIIVGLSDFLYIKKFLKGRIPQDFIDGLSRGSKREEVEKAISNEFEHLRKINENK